MESRRLASSHVAALIVLVACVLGTSIAKGVHAPAAAEPAQAGAQKKPLEKPPEGQTFIGTKECASCHLDQYLTWKATKHAKGFDILPAKYREDMSCLKCHATALGEKTGFVNIKTTPNLAGTSCEACHGPGSEHATIAKGFGTKKLDEGEKAYVKSTIFKVQPKNVCVECHIDQTHKKHPPFDKK
jgi:hypothetical protein